MSRRCRQSVCATLAVTLKAVGRLYTRSELLTERALWRQQGKTVVFTNGCYDLLHVAHIRVLKKSRELGDLLVVGLNTDASVKLSKGPKRPLIPQSERAEMLLALASVDGVVFFEEETPRELIRELLPDILVKSADWSHFIAGREEVEAAGGKVVILPLEPGYSTTGIIEKILTLQP